MSLGHKQAADRSQALIPVEELQIPRELLDAVDLSAALDLDGDRYTFPVPAQEIHRANRRGIFPPDQLHTVAQRLGSFCEQSLQFRLHSVLVQARVVFP